MRRFKLAVVALATLATLAAATAMADPSPPSAKVACKPSAMALCHAEATADDRAAIRACLIRNFDKVSPGCQAAMKAARAQEQAAKPNAPSPKP